MKYRLRRPFHILEFSQFGVYDLGLCNNKSLNGCRFEDRVVLARDHAASDCAAPGPIKSRANKQLINQVLRRIILIR